MKTVEVSGLGIGGCEDPRVVDRIEIGVDRSVIVGESVGSRVGVTSQDVGTSDGSSEVTRELPVTFVVSEIRQTVGRGWVGSDQKNGLAGDVVPSCGRLDDSRVVDLGKIGSHDLEILTEPLRVGLGVDERGVESVDLPAFLGIGDLDAEKDGVLRARPTGLYLEHRGDPLDAGVIKATLLTSARGVGGHGHVTLGVSHEETETEILIRIIRVVKDLRPPVHAVDQEGFVNESRSIGLSLSADGSIPDRIVTLNQAIPSDGECAEESGLTGSLHPVGKRGILAGVDVGHGLGAKDRLELTGDETVSPEQRVGMNSNLILEDIVGVGVSDRLGSPKVELLGIEVTNLRSGTPMANSKGFMMGN